MRAKVQLFTSPTCPHCHHARQVMAELVKERKDFDYVELSTATSAGSRAASRYQIMSVPTFIITGPGFVDPIGLVGGQSKKVINKYLDIALGLREVDEAKPGFFSRLKQGIKIGKMRIKL